MHFRPTLLVCLISLAAGRAWAAPPALGPAAAMLALAADEANDCFPPLAEGGFRFRGARTCQSAACHGSLEPRPGKIRRNEYTLWRDKDPHAKAYSNITLDNKLANQMLHILGIARDNKIVDQAGFQNCEKCHNLALPEQKIDGAEALREGVSCEACHGPSDKWYDKHFKVGFNRREAVAKEGLIDTQDLFVRARLCARCHVGAADREVNHDLLAAGHPQLRFEMAAYLNLVPKHWNDAAERAAPGNDQFELRLWAAGQIASADAALAQLEARAQRAAAKKPGVIWPEFAEMDCFACHHDLEFPSWRQERGFGERRAGDLPWGSWYFSLIERVAKVSSQPGAGGPGSEAAGKFHGAVGQLKKSLESKLVPTPGPIEAEARAARQALFAWARPDGGAVAGLSRPERMRAAFEAFAAEKGEGGIVGQAVVETWETATQLYLAVSAANQAHRDEGKKQNRRETADDKAVADRIRQLRADLAFAAGFDSPHEFGGLNPGAGANASPREKVRLDLLQVFQQLNRRGDK